MLSRFFRWFWTSNPSSFSNWHPDDEKIFGRSYSNITNEHGLRIFQARNSVGWCYIRIERLPVHVNLLYGINAFKYLRLTGYARTIVALHLRVSTFEVKHQLNGPIKELSNWIVTNLFIWQAHHMSVSRILRDTQKSCLLSYEVWVALTWRDSTHQEEE